MNDYNLPYYSKFDYDDLTEYCFTIVILGSSRFTSYDLSNPSYLVHYSTKKCLLCPVINADAPTSSPRRLVAPVLELAT